MGNLSSVLCVVFDRRTVEIFEGHVQQHVAFKDGNVTVLHADRIDKLLTSMQAFCFTAQELSASDAKTTYQHRDKITELRDALDVEFAGLEKLAELLTQAQRIGYDTLRYHKVSERTGDASPKGEVAFLLSTDPATTSALTRPILDARSAIEGVGKALFDSWLEWHRSRSDETVDAFPGTDTAVRAVRCPVPAVHVADGYASVLAA